MEKVCFKLMIWLNIFNMSIFFDGSVGVLSDFEYQPEDWVLDSHVGQIIIIFSDA